MQTFQMKVLNVIVISNPKTVHDPQRKGSEAIFLIAALIMENNGMFQTLILILIRSVLFVILLIFFHIKITIYNFSSSSAILESLSTPKSLTNSSAWCASKNVIHSSAGGFFHCFIKLYVSLICSGLLQSTEHKKVSKASGIDLKWFLHISKISF